MKSIKSKIIFWFVISVVSLLGILAFFVYTEISSVLMPIISDMGKEIVSGRANQIQEQIDGFAKEILAISQKDSVQSIYWTWAKTDLQKSLDSIPYYKVFLLADKDGNSNSTLQETKEKISEKEYFIRMKEGDQRYISNGEHLDTGEKIFYIFVPIKDSSGEFKGVFGAGIDLSVFSAFSNQVRIGKNGYGFIIDKDGNYLSFTDESKLVTENFYSNNNISSDLKDISEKLFIRKNNSNEEELYIYSTIKGTPDWIFSIMVPLKDFFSQADTVSFTVLIFILVIILILLVIAYFLGNNISKPIKKIALKIDAFGEGNLKTSL